MKKHIKLTRNHCLLFFSTLFAIVLSCSDNKGDNNQSYDPSRPVTITSFFPDSGKIASKVILEGSNFGNDPSIVKVYFNEKKAQIVGTVNDKMYVLTPRLPGEICKISIVIGKDSLVYDETFRYHETHNLTTVVGKENSGKAFKGGTLAETEFSEFIAHAFFAPNDELLLSCHAPSGVDESTVIYVSEKDDLTRDCWIPGQKRNGVHVLDCDPRTGIVYGGDREGDVYYEMDPEALWVVRRRTIAHPTAEEQAEGYVNWNGALQYKQSVGFSRYDNMLYTRDKSGLIVKWDPNIKIGSKVGDAISTGIGDDGDSRILFSPIESEAHILYFSAEGKHAIYMIDLKSSDKKATIFTGTGSGAGGHRDGVLNDAEFKKPKQIAFDKKGENMYVVDSDNHCVRQIDMKTKMVTTIAGQPGKSGYKDGDPSESLFKSPQGVSVNSLDEIYIVDRGNRVVRKLTIE